MLILYSRGAVWGLHTWRVFCGLYYHAVCHAQDQKKNIIDALRDEMT